MMMIIKVLIIINEHSMTFNLDAGLLIAIGEYETNSAHLQPGDCWLISSRPSLYTFSWCGEVLFKIAHILISKIQHTVWLTLLHQQHRIFFFISAAVSTTNYFLANAMWWEWLQAKEIKKKVFSRNLGRKKIMVSCYV